TIANELNVAEHQVQAACDLLDDGATVPFIARYRKEATGGLDDTQLRLLDERLHYLRELESRKQTVLKSIEEQGKLSDELLEKIKACDNKTALEDIYLPYKPKRRTKAQIARENGLQPLADLLLKEPFRQPEKEAEVFVNAEKNLPDIKAVLDGARAILMETFAEDADLIAALREQFWHTALLHSQVIAGKESDGEKFKDYFDFSEQIATIPSHRALAVLRGRNEEVLKISLKYQSDDTPLTEQSVFEKMIIKHFRLPENADKWIFDTVRLAWRAKIFLSLELDALSKLKEIADSDAIEVFSKNLKDLLLAAPLGRIPTLGLDPGYKNGIKTAAVDDTGKMTATKIVYLHREEEALFELEKIIKNNNIQFIAIGNGTASRETDKLAGILLNRLSEKNIRKITVSEAGASVYSASEIAAEEFPDLDVSLRGAVSIARRLQDPLAELVKIDPKSIGVGQYQHDVDQIRLAKSLDAVVEDCVNAVGVDLNTASAPLLARVSGLNKTIAKNIVAYRNENGAFKKRQELLKVPRLGSKAFEQAAGFLRIMNGDEPLDASAVHPESYGVVKKMLANLGVTAKDLIGNNELLRKIKAVDYTDEQFGLPTVMDILSELDKPGRDPRGEFKTATFAENIHEIKDLTIGMELEGTVTNVADFGAFIDIGVHQDGLVHISQMADRYIANPREIVKAGDIVRVRVIEIDEKRKRISLSMKKNEVSGSTKKEQNIKPPKSTPQPQTAMAAAFAKLRR
ncbi:MAG: RNA-binding transcriptional accessory protein, partial [Neisseriaceae bacterium]|nr:RNA-binding transcriptional accessory protein [Neisseriaceae bacterium]